MPYELQTDPILAGSLNLLAPGELGGETDAIAMHNWRIDQGGQLRSRLGMGAAVATGLGAHVHSIARVEAAAPRRYFGADANWFRGSTNISSGFDGNPFGMVSFQGRCWAMNRSRQLKDDGTNTWNWTPTAPPTAPVITPNGAASGQLNGDYSWWVTGVTDAGEETNPSPAGTATALSLQSVLVAYAAFTDPQITQWNVYREGGNFPNQRYKLNPTPLLLAVTVINDDGTDDTGTGGPDYSDNGIANLGVILAIDHDPAPPAKFVAGPYLGRLYALGTAANPNRMFYTEADQPAFFPGSGTNAGGDWTDIGELGEEFIGAAVFPQVLLIIKSKSVWRLIGDPSTGEIERLNIDVGGIGVKAWAVSGATVYFQTQEGISRTSVSSTGQVSPDLVPIFKGDPVEAYGAIPATPLDSSATARGRAAMAFINGRLYFSFASAGGSGYPDTTLVWNEKTQQWGTDSRGFTALYYEGQGGSLLGAIVGGSVYPLEQGTDDNGASIAPVFQTRFRNQGQPNVQKHYANLEIQHRLNGATFKVSVIFDGKASTLTQIGTITSAADKVWSVLPIPDFNSGSEPRSIAVRIELTVAGTGYEEILAMALRWYPVPLDGVVFDSGNVKLAGGQACLVKNIEIDIENPGGGALTWEWFSDLPGNEIVSYGARSLTATGIGTFQVAAPVTYARWARLIVRVASGAGRVFGARVQARPVGVYLDGVAFDSQFFKLDSGQPCFVQNLEIDLECDGGGNVTCGWFSDLPGNMMAAKGTIPIGQPTGAGTFRVALPVTEAAWARIVVQTSAGICRVLGARVQVRPIGLYLAGTGDGYRTAELTAGSPRLKLLSGMRISAQADGNIPAHLSTDIPEAAGTTALVDVKDLNIPATIERQWFEMKLPSTTRAKLLRLAIDSPAVARIFQILVRVKVLGENPSAWQWFEVPIPQTPDEWTTREIPVPQTAETWAWADLPISGKQ